MGKIPVAATIENAYGFAFRNFLSLLGISWLPMLLMGIGFYFVFQPYLNALEILMTTEDPSAFLAIIPTFALVMVLSFVLMSMMLVGMTALALGQIQGPVFVYFSLGYPVWRLLGAFICVYLLIFVLMFGAILGGGAIAGAAALSAGEGAAAALGVIGIIILFPLFFYFAFRIIFFLVPVTVAERRRVVRRSWALGRGNVWRIVVVLLAAVFPAMAVQMVVQSVVIGQVMMSMSFPTEDLPPEQAVAFMMDMFGRMWAVMPILLPVWLITSIFMYGALSAAAAFAYRVLVPYGESPETNAAA